MPIQSNANVLDLSKRLKSAESANADLSRRNDELTSDLNNANADNGRLTAENARLRQLCNDLQDKCDALARENKQLSGKVLYMYIHTYKHTWMCVHSNDSR